jgi:hypothetical protein
MGDQELTSERMFAVAVRDGKDLFLWFRIRRAARGDLYYMIPTGRTGAEWRKWDPHGSLHKDGRFHHKGYDQKIMAQERQKPDANFKGVENMVTRPISSDEPRAFGVICDLAEFSEVMEIPVEMLSPNKYETVISIDVTEPGGQAIVTFPGREILAQRVFDDSVPHVLVSVQGPSIRAREQEREPKQ